jgi:hypothetical protein
VTIDERLAMILNHDGVNVILRPGSGGP